MVLTTASPGSCLSLVACFESEVLSRNDAPRGGFFHVEGIYARTPSGKRFRKMYRRVFYVTRGQASPRAFQAQPKTVRPRD
jgi:hypothetical protein